MPSPFVHPLVSRRTAVRAGAVGLLGLGSHHVSAMRAMAGTESKATKAKSVIYIFLSGGLAQHESFDPKPDAPAEIRGEFGTIATKTPGVRISEHLPRLAARSDRWAMVRSLTHPHTGHSHGHMAMLSGRTPLPTGFDSNKPKPTDWPSIASLATRGVAPRNNLPPAVVLPETLIHREGKVVPGQFAGELGAKWNPWFVAASAYNATSYGAYPEYGFHFERGNENPKGWAFKAPDVSLPVELSADRMGDRQSLLSGLESKLRTLDRTAEHADFDRHRQRAVSLLADKRIRSALDVTHAPDKVQERYGKNLFGWSLLMARNLVEAGVSLVQVNLGNNETWDTHQAAFPILKNNLLPPTDRAVAALLDDLADSGLLDDTLIVMAGEFGRTPKISTISGAKLPGRDHWGPVQSVFFAGGGVKGGTVIGSSDRIGAYPSTDPQTPENMAATIYSALGIPQSLMVTDTQDRPHHVYHGEPIKGLM